MQTQEAARKRRPRSDRGPRITTRDLNTLAWIGQQYAVSLDHLCILLARLTEPGAYARTPKQTGELTEKRAMDIVRRWQALGLVEKAWILHNEPPWIYLTSEGLRLVAKDTGQLRSYTPTPAKIEHIYNVNAVRLFIESRRQDAVWTSERQLCAGQKIGSGKKQPHRPDAVILTHSRQEELIKVALEIELTNKSRSRIDKILHELASTAEYHTIWYFAKGRTHNLIKKAIDDMQQVHRSKFAVYNLEDIKLI